VVPHYSADDEPQIPARRQGSGLVSLQHALLLIGFGRTRAAQGKSFFMAIEEPELHVPPPLQRRLIHRIRSLSTQSIIITHSPLVASACEPSSVRVLSKLSGNLSSEPLTDSAIVRSDPNWKRTLFGIKRQDTLAALMHEVVLIPEGRIDFDVLTVLVNAEEVHRKPTAAIPSEREFGALVGVIPTADAQVVATFGELSKVHRRAVCLVDGDKAGDYYVSALVNLKAPPRLVLQLPQKWFIEDVVGWIVSADATAALKDIGAELGMTLNKVDDLTQKLKTETKLGGLKGDRVVYEMMLATLAERPACLGRIKLFLQQSAEACVSGAATQRWHGTAASLGVTKVLRFVP
jgi:hypothetical protein